MSTSPNPFAVPLRPVGIRTMCAQSDALNTLPLNANRRSPHVVGELAEHDAAVHAIYHELFAKAAKASAAKPKSA